MTRILVCILTLLSFTRADAAEISSPRVERLRLAIQNDPHALEQFWRDVQVTGTPLIEPAVDDAAHALVTFIWRGSESLPNVIVFASVLPDNDPARQRLNHLAGTDVWYRTYRFRRDLPILYEMSPRGTEELQRDPLNPVFVDGAMGGSAALLPGLRNLEWSSPPVSSRGKIEQILFASEQLKNERTVSVYLPAGFQRGQDYDVLVVVDENIYNGPVPLPTILDNLIAAREIPPMVAVMIGNADRAAELSCSKQFSTFLTKELLPQIGRLYVFERRRERTTILGSSLGGLAAACAGIHAPEEFGNVIALSGSFRWRPEGDAEPEWLARQLAATPAAPIRLLVGVGSHETATPQEPGNPSLLTASRHLRDVLRAKGYRLDYREFPGAHDPLSWRSALPDLLKGLR